MVDLKELLASLDMLNLKTRKELDKIYNYYNFSFLSNTKKRIKFKNFLKGLNTNFVFEKIGCNSECFIKTKHIRITNDFENGSLQNVLNFDTDKLTLFIDCLKENNLVFEKDFFSNLYTMQLLLINSEEIFKECLKAHTKRELTEFYLKCDFEDNLMDSVEELLFSLKEVEQEIKDYLKVVNFVEKEYYN